MSAVTTVDALAKRLGTRDGLDRVQAMLGERGGEGEAKRAPLQWAGELFMPGLGARPWHEREELAWVPAVERVACAVREELDGLLESGVHQPYDEPFDAELYAGDARAATVPREAATWNVFFLYRVGRWLDANANHCPATRAALQATPMSLGEAFFSILEPGGRIPVHSGQWNVVLTCHLGLVVPDDCAIEVAGERRTWREGEVLVFDDSFAHAAWNDAPTPRVCLLWDIWHPDLTPVEVRALKLLLPLLSRAGA